MEFLQSIAGQFLLSTSIGVILFFTYGKVKHYLQIIYILIDAIELIDYSIKDILSDEQMARILKVKEYIAKKLKPVDKKKLDELLKRKGYKS